MDGVEAGVDANVGSIAVAVDVRGDKLSFMQVVDGRGSEDEGVVDSSKDVAAEEGEGGSVGARKGSKKADCNPIAFHCKSLSLHESTLPLLS